MAPLTNRRFLELKAYILQRRDELVAAEGGSSKKISGGKRGGMVTAEELMGEDGSPASSAIKKGFS